MKSFFEHKRGEVKFDMGTQLYRESIDPLKLFVFEDYSRDFMDQWHSDSYYDRLRHLSGKKNHRDMALSIAVRAHFERWNYRFGNSRITF